MQVGLDQHMNRTDRLLAIVLELQAKGWQRAEDLAKSFEISKRTIYRDMDALAESGVPVVSSPGQGYSLVEGYFLPPLHFTSEEAMILLLGADFVAQNFDAQYRAAARSASSKIQAVLPERMRGELRQLQSSMRFIAINALENSARPEVLQQIRRAIIEHKTIRMDYHTRSGEEVAGSKNQRAVDPYGLIHLDKGWYMVAYCHLRQDIRHFRLDRIDRLQVSDRTFAQPANFSLIPYPLPMDKGGIVIRALFSPAVMRWVQEAPSFYTVASEETADGLMVTFNVRNESELLQWLLGWGRHVQVLEPESLKMLMIEETEAILYIYKQAESLLP
jgi:predicted DNA-binding transcriptional regulator YafY